MQKLHLVGFTTDHRGLIFSARRGAKSGSFVVDVGDDLFAAVDDVRTVRDEAIAEAASEQGAALANHRDRPESNLGVREIQARLRQGQSIDAVAAKAGVDVTWVGRFAAPVLTEMAEVVRTVRAERFVKQRIGSSGAPLGESVYRNLLDRGVTTPRDELDRSWSARQVTDGEWEVRFHYVSRGRTVSVAWGYDEATRKVVGRDRLASQLAFRPGGPPPSTRVKGTGGAAGATAVADAAAEDKQRAPSVKATSKRVASARKAARARMVAEAEKATKRDAAVARKALKRRPRPAVEPELDVPDEPDLVVDVSEDTEADAGAVAEVDEEAAAEVAELDVLEEVEDEEAVPATRKRAPVGRRPFAPEVAPEPVRRREPLRAARVARVAPSSHAVPVFHPDLARPVTDGNVGALPLRASAARARRVQLRAR